MALLYLEKEEREFWTRLALRVCSEIDKMPVFRRQRLWCDSFLPEVYLLDHSPREITGLVWIDSQGQEQWRFRLFLPSSSSAAHVAWS